MRRTWPADQPTVSSTVSILSLLVSRPRSAVLNRNLLVDHRPCLFEPSAPAAELEHAARPSCGDSASKIAGKGPEDRRNQPPLVGLRHRIHPQPVLIVPQVRTLRRGLPGGQIARNRNDLRTASGGLLVVLLLIRSCRRSTSLALMQGDAARTGCRPAPGRGATRRREFAGCVASRPRTTTVGPLLPSRRVDVERGGGSPLWIGGHHRVSPPGLGGPMIDRMAEIGGTRVPSGRDAVRLVRTDAHRDRRDRRERCESSPAPGPGTVRRVTAG